MKIVKKIMITLAVLLLYVISMDMKSYAEPLQMPGGGMFDPEYYAFTNPDVVAVCGTSLEGLYSHYCNYGKKEGRKPCFSMDIGKKSFSINSFRRIGVIGDSFASGSLMVNGELKDCYDASWPQIMAKRYGVTCTNYTKGGMTTLSWLVDPCGNKKLHESKPDDLYILALGINDSHSWFLNPEKYLGNAKDIGTKADTFYGNYGKIIEQIKAHAPNAKMVILNIVYEPTVYTEKYNAAIREIAAYYGIPYIDQNADAEFRVSDYMDKQAGHPTRKGYSKMADSYAKLIKECGKNNKFYFYPYYQ